MPNGGDFVTYREMVEYVNGQVAEFHGIRAESLRQIGVELEKIEKDFADHQTWHRTLLERMLDRGQDNRMALAGLVIGALGVVVAIITVVVVR